MCEIRVCVCHISKYIHIYIHKISKNILKHTCTIHTYVCKKNNLGWIFGVLKRGERKLSFSFVFLFSFNYLIFLHDICVCVTFICICNYIFSDSVLRLVRRSRPSRRRREKSPPSLTDSNPFWVNVFILTSLYFIYFLRILYS